MDALVAQVIAKGRAGLTEEAAEGTGRDAGGVGSLLEPHIIREMDVEVGHGLAQRGRRVCAYALDGEHHPPLLLAKRAEKREAEVVKPPAVLLDDGSRARDEAEIGQGPRADIMHRELVSAPSALLTRESMGGTMPPLSCPHSLTLLHLQL